MKAEPANKKREIARPDYAADLPCITIWQPWASLIILGIKQYEFRSWRAPRAFIGQRIGIHAASRMPTLKSLREIVEDPAETCGPRCDAETARRFAQMGLRQAACMPLGALLGTVELGKPVRASELYLHGSPSIWAWPVSKPVHLSDPWPMEGWQKFWRFEGGEQAYHDRLKAGVARRA
jgi:hypothetical protein